MKYEITIPSVGESITEVVIGRILKPSGTFVKRDEEILEIETEKVNQSLFAPEEGVLTLSVKEQQKVRVGTVIGAVDSEGVSQERPSEPPQEIEKNIEVQKKKYSESRLDLPESVNPIESKRLKQASFVNELKAKEPETLESTSKSNELSNERETMESHIEAKQGKRKKMSSIRKVIAKRLVDSLHQSAMLTTFNEVDLSLVNELRAKYKEQYLKQYGVKLGFMSFFAKATVDALKAFPSVNSYIDGDEIVERESYNIGIAVSTDRGLVVPVIKNCDRLGYGQIEKQIADYAKRAREGKLQLSDLEGGGFTITNGGTFGSLLSTPILNPPQSAILGMHKMMERPVVVDHQIVIRPMMYLALSYDHRLIDGREAVTFLVHIKEILEDPSRLLFIPENP